MKSSIISICNHISQLGDEDFVEMREMAKNQLEYLNPLKNGTASRLHAKGNHNLEVLKRLEELRDFILTADGIVKEKS